MPEFIYASSNLTVFLVLIGFTSLLAVTFIFINKHLFFHVLRYKDNTTVSSISALIGIIYGVLVGFVCLYLLNNQDHASQASQAEANAASTILRRSFLLSPQIQETVQKNLRKYANEVINQEWPAMAKFKRVGPEGDMILMDMIKSLKNFKPQSAVDNVIYLDLLTSSIKDLYNARHTRIMMSYITLGNETWYVILIGTVLIIAVNYAFRANFYLHLFVNIVFAIMAGSMLFLIVSLDRPFQGDFAVTPEPFREVLEILNTTQANKK